MKQLFLTALLLCTLHSFSQGPIDGFFKGKGNLDLAFTGFYQHSKIFYDGIGPFEYPRTLSGASAFAEYGILENLDVVTTLPFINGKFQDAGIYIKYGLPFNRSAKERRISIVPAGGISFPISKYNTESGQSIGQRAVQFQPKMVVQWKTKYGIYLQAQAGYNHTLKPVPSSWIYSSKIAVTIKKFYIDFWFEHQEGIGGKAWHVDPITSFRELFVTYNKIGGAVFWGVKPNYGFFLNTSRFLNGINVGKAFSIGAGFVYKLDFY